MGILESVFFAMHLGIFFCGTVSDQFNDIKELIIVISSALTKIRACR